jgi:hypothetical protein
MQGRFGVDILVHIKGMAELISDDLRIDFQFVHQRRMRSSHHLEINPPQTRRLQPRMNPPVPDVVSPDGGVTLF